MYNVFISCKSEDYPKAEPVYHWLVRMGHCPFFAPISLNVKDREVQLGVYGEEIDRALEQADNMIVFASKAEYVSHGYVRDEWRIFVEEQRSGRKKGSLVTILDGVNVADLPIRLRPVQSYTLSNYQEGILSYLGNPLGMVVGEGGEGHGFNTDLIISVNGVSFIMKPVEGGIVQGVSVNTFFIGETQVTQSLWKAVTGNEPSLFKGDNLPVEQVSYNDIVNVFIPKLNQLTGRNFRLPTETEWDFAARGGRKSNGYVYSGSNNIDHVAWYWRNSGKTYINEEDECWSEIIMSRNKCSSHAVKLKLPNELGLYDMSGNVWEWCNTLNGECRVLRGGSWYTRAKDCQISIRSADFASVRDGNYGCRLAISEG